MIVGIDEVGRGCWAGPLVAGAVILRSPVPGLDDSKKLSKKKRNELALLIQANAEVGLGWVSAGEVDSLGLTEAVRLAMQRAYDGLSLEHDKIIIDGNYNFLAHIENTEAIIQADGSIPAVSAASIVAKVARDTYMEQLIGYDNWEFSRHVGYGTARHIELLAQYGVSDQHRLSYKPIKRILAA